MLEFLSEAHNLIHKDLNLDHQDVPSDYEQLLDAIEERVTELLDQNEELLFSFLYRLDISERHLKSVLADNQIDDIKAISKLILDRQLLRLQTKKSYPQQPIKGWDW